MKQKPGPGDNFWKGLAIATPLSVALWYAFFYYIIL